MAEPNTEVCNLLVKIGTGEEIQATATETLKLTNGAHVVSLTVDQRLDAPDAFSIQFMSSREGERTVFDWAKEGEEVQLGFGYEKPIEAMFKGEVVYVETEYDAEGGSFVTLRGYDRSHRLTRGFGAGTWGDGLTEDQVLSDVVSDVIGASKEEKGGSSDNLAADQVDSTEFKSRYIPKAMTTDYDFIKWAGSNLARASDSGKEDDKRVSFRKLDITQTEVATVCYEKMDGTNPIRSIRARFQIATYPVYAKVRVHGWDVKEKKAFVGEVEACSPEIDGANENKGQEKPDGTTSKAWVAGWKASGKAHYTSEGAGAVYERVMEFAEHKDEAEKIAQGIFDSFSLRYLTGEAEVMGWPEIAPGCTVMFNGFGDRVTGKVIVTEATHHISAAAGQPYVTSFKFVSNAAGPKL